jgi:geranylgeranyl diphosphate synthase type II
MYTSNEILQKVNQFIDQQSYDRQPASLYEPIEYVLSLGGKRIRPVLMLLTYNLYKDDPESILMPAIGLETYHNYTLLHDDLMDNADMRRGHDTVHKRWDANKAILSGDSMLVLAYQRMQHCDSQHLQAVLDVFTETALEIGEGQEYDMSFETRNDVTEGEYIEMIRLKTSVLLAGSLKIGAILADAPAHDANLLYDFGICLGLAFQLKDDLLDVYGDPAVFGKKNGGDILCNKKTFLLLTAMETADAESKAELLQWMMATDRNEEKIAAVTAIYTRLNVREAAESVMEEHTAIALEQLDKLPQNAACEQLRELAEKLVTRKS